MEYETSLENPIDITIENKSKINQAIRYFDCNFQDILEPGDKVILTVTSSERLAYYTKIKEELEKGAESKELTPDDFARITMNYLNDEQGYNFTGFERNEEVTERIEYKFFVSDRYESVTISHEEDNVYANNISFVVTMTLQGEVTDYQHLDN